MVSQMASRFSFLLSCVGAAQAITSEMQNAWANNGVYEHSPKSQRKVNGVQSGENIGMGSSLTGLEVTKLWYAEVQYTDPYGTADSMDDSTDSSEEIGHYTAMIWSTSTKLGCGKGKSKVSGSAGDYWVCQYGPAGNVVGQFSQKVLAPTKAVTACGGSSSDIPGGGDGLTNSATKNNGDIVLPSSCKPSAPLPPGGLCVYGYQCASNFCCPRMKVCLANPSASVLSSELQVPEEIKTEIVNLVFKNGGACTDPYSNSKQCQQSQDGQPFSTWNQAMCGCKDAYMTRYAANTWVTLNKHPGFTCSADIGSVSNALRAASASWTLGASLAVAAAVFALGSPSLVR